MNSGLIERLLATAKLRGMSPRAVSLTAGMGPTAVRDIVRRPGASPSVETIRKLAKALQCSPNWLAYGMEVPAGGLDAEAAESDRLRLGEWGDVEDIGSVTHIKVQLVLAAYGGVVEAGAFRPVDDLNDVSGVDPISVPKDRHFPFAKLVFFDVAGDSMNALKPRPIFAGDRLICIDYEASISRLPFRDGMVVVVEQTTGGGHLRERSVKQLEIHGDRHEFHPRSTSPRHKPIIIPTDPQADDGRMVRIIAIVRRIENEVPLS